MRKVLYEVIWAIINASLFSKNCDILAKLGCHIKIIECFSPTDIELNENVFFITKSLI